MVHVWCSVGGAANVGSTTGVDGKGAERPAISQ